MAVSLAGLAGLAALAGGMGLSGAIGRDAAGRAEPRPEAPPLAAGRGDGHAPVWGATALGVDVPWPGGFDTAEITDGPRYSLGRRLCRETMAEVGTIGKPWVSVALVGIILLYGASLCVTGGLRFRWGGVGVIAGAVYPADGVPRSDQGTSCWFLYRHRPNLTFGYVPQKIAIPGSVVSLIPTWMPALACAVTIIVAAWWRRGRSDAGTHGR